MAQRINAVLAAGPARFLEPKGFKKAARVWRRPSGDGVQVIQVQASRGPMGAVGRFTLTLAVYLPRVEELMGRERVASPREHQCTLRARIGEVMPDRQDFWWVVDEGTDVADLAIDVCEKLERFGLPWLDRASRERDFRVVTAAERWRGVTLNDVLAALLERDRAGARRAIEQLMRDPLVPAGTRDQALRLASRTGLT